MGTKLSYLTPKAKGKLTITGIRDVKGKVLEKGTCNTPGILIKADVPLEGGTLLYTQEGTL